MGYQLTHADSSQPLSSFLPAVPGVAWYGSNPVPATDEFLLAEEVTPEYYLINNNANIIALGIKTSSTPARSISQEAAFSNAVTYARWDAEGTFVDVYMPEEFIDVVKLLAPSKARHCFRKEEEPILEQLKWSIAERCRK